MKLIVTQILMKPEAYQYIWEEQKSRMNQKNMNATMEYILLFSFQLLR